MRISVKNLVIISLLISTISFTSCSKDDASDDIYLNEDQAATTSVNKNTVTYNYSNIEKETLEVINTYRESIGLNSLVTIDLISTQAETHTDYIVKEGKISHDKFNTRANFLIKNLPAKSIGENVASGFSSAKSVVNAWLNSPTHKAIIENDNYTHTGISIKTDENGKKYFVQLFAVR
ncbi:MAG: CAP domain-containing protein [Flavobacteriaceae bacterium]|nr:CAP domain-containing protein [Flavobacteriaceae bacterium]